MSRNRRKLHGIELQRKAVMYQRKKVCTTYRIEAFVLSRRQPPPPRLTSMGLLHGGIDSESDRIITP